MSQNADLRALCNRFLDAIESGDMAAMSDVLSPDLKFWANITNQAKSRDELLETVSKGKALHRSRTYDDRQIRTLEHGFLVQYTCKITRHDGSGLALWAAIVAEAQDGKIVKIDEYIDSGKFTKKLES